MPTFLLLLFSDRREIRTQQLTLILNLFKKLRTLQLPLPLIIIPPHKQFLPLIFHLPIQLFLHKEQTNPLNQPSKVKPRRLLKIIHKKLHNFRPNQHFPIPLLF